MKLSNLYLNRLFIQGLQSVNQLLTTLIFLKILSVREFGVLSLFLILAMFFLGIGTNSYLYTSGFNCSNNTKVFLKFTVIFIITELLVYLLVSGIFNFYPSIVILLLIKSQTARIQEFINRLSFEVDDNRFLVDSGIIKFLQFSLIFLLLLSINNFVKSDVIIFLLTIDLIAFLCLFLRLYFHKQRLSNTFNFKVLFSNESKLNTQNFFLYFSKAQVSGLILSSFSLEGFAIYTASRILAAPVSIITPVLSSISLSNVIKNNMGILNSTKKLIMASLLIIYTIIIIFLSETFYTFFYGYYSNTYLIYSLLHIIIALFAFFRSILESELQGFKALDLIFKVNLISFPFSIILSFTLVKNFNIYGAFISLLLTELFILTLYKFLKNNNDNIL